MKRSEMIRKMAIAHSALDWSGKSYDYDELATYLLSIIEEAGMQPPNISLNELISGPLKVDYEYKHYYACWEPEDD